MSLFIFFIEMKRKRTLHSWFASSSNTLPIVPESNVAPINVIVQPTLIENIIPDDPTNESTNPSVDVSTNPSVGESTNWYITLSSWY